MLQPAAGSRSELGGVTHLVYAALYERPGLVAGWQEEEQIRTNDLMLRNLLGPIERARRPCATSPCCRAPRPMACMSGRSPCPPARTARRCTSSRTSTGTRSAICASAQEGKAWSWSILRPVLIVGCSVGSAMNVIPALGVYAAMMRRAGKTRLDYPGGVGRVAQAVDADLLARAIAWSGEAANGQERDLQRHQRRRLRLAQRVARHRRRAGLRGGRARAAPPRQRDPPAGGGVGRDPRSARAHVGHAQGVRRAFLRVCRLHDGLRPRRGPARPPSCRPSS